MADEVKQNNNKDVVVYFTQKELAQRWRISESTVKSIRDRGEIPYFFPPNSSRVLYPREEILTIEYGGARYPKAVECAPQRRIDVALRLMVQGSYHKSFNTKKSIVDTLVDEIYNAYTLSMTSNAIAKKNEMERQADSSR